MAEVERTLRNCGLDLEVVTVLEKSAVTGKSVAEIESMGQGKFFILQIERKDGGHITSPEQAFKVHGGDGLVIRAQQRCCGAGLISTRQRRQRAGRTHVRNAAVAGFYFPLLA